MMEITEIEPLTILDTYNKWKIEENKYRVYLHNNYICNVYLLTVWFNYYLMCIYIYNIQYYLLLNLIYFIYYTDLFYTT